MSFQNSLGFPLYCHFLLYDLTSQPFYMVPASFWYFMFHVIFSSKTHINYFCYYGMTGLKCWLPSLINLCFQLLKLVKSHICSKLFKAISPRNTHTHTSLSLWERDLSMLSPVTVMSNCTCVQKNVKVYKKRNKNKNSVATVTKPRCYFTVMSCTGLAKASANCEWTSSRY